MNTEEKPIEPAYLQNPDTQNENNSRKFPNTASAFASAGQKADGVLHLPKGISPSELFSDTESISAEEADSTAESKRQFSADSFFADSGGHNQQRPGAGLAPSTNSSERDGKTRARRVLRRWKPEVRERGINANVMQIDFVLSAGCNTN